MPDDTTTLKLNLDASQFLDAIQQAKSGVGELGSTENLRSMVEAFDSAIPVLGALAAAFAGVKGAFAETFKAEDINAVNEQFDLLAKNAGASGEQIKAGMEKAAGGLIDSTTQTKLANQAMVLLGGSAKEIPKIMELARKASIVSGEDFITTFNNMNIAIATGRKETLDRMGLTIDTTKAEQQYANQIGVTVDALTQEGKTHAILNAVLEQGATKFNGVNVNIKEAQDTWTQFKVTMTEIGDTFALVWNRIFGPSVIKGLQALREAANSVLTTLRINLGDASEQAEGLATAIAKDQTELKRLQSGDLSWWEKLSPMTVKNRIDTLTQSIPKLQEKLKSLQTQAEAERGPTAAGGASPDVKQREIDHDKMIEQETKFQAEMLKLKQANEKESEKLADDEASIAKKYDMEMVFARKEATNQIKALQAQVAQGKLSSSQADKIAGQIQEGLVLKERVIAKERIQLAEEVFKAKMRALDEESLATDRFFSKFALGARKASLQAEHDFNDFEKLGTQMSTKLSNNVGNAFQQIGQGSKDVGTAMKEAFIGALADQAAAQGSYAMLAAFATFPPNFGMLSAGIGLEALSGVLRGIAGGSSSITTPSVGAGGAVIGASGITAAVASGGTGVPTAQATQQQGVTVVVQGSYFDSEETMTRLTDIIRQSSDIGNFTIKSVGSSVGTL